MKLLTLNFLTCARKACKPLPDSFPLQPKDCTLELLETDFNPLFLANMLPRLDWPAMLSITNELGLTGLKEVAPEREEILPAGEGGAKGDEETQTEEGTQMARDLHQLLMETCVMEGKLVCRACGHEYAVKEGIANFLLPSHLV